MKERPVDLQRTVIAHNEPTKVAQPSERALDRPAPFVAPEDASILRRRAMAVRAMRCDQQDAPPPQPSPQCVAVIALVGDHPQRLLTRAARAMSPAYTDRRERRFREPDFRRGRRTKVVPQRNSAAVDHHHPLRPLAPLGFSDFRAPFLAGAKLPSRNDSLHFNCWRSFNSLKNARQMFSQTPCSSQSRSRRQQVEGCGYFSGISFQHPTVLDPRATALAVLARFGKQGRDFLPLRFGQQRTGSRHRPSFGAADSAYPAFRKKQPSSFQTFVSGYATASTCIEEPRALRLLPFLR